ncbi:hypothetical protein GC174_10205 [bacterium]|nr:hypothetical protein [bacterium]
MVVYSRGFAPQNILTKEEAEEEKRFFLENLPVLLKHQKVVLDNPKYFFSLPGSFAFGSWPYIPGDGPVYTGYLLLGWQSGGLLEHCTECGGSIYLVGVGGSPLSGSGSCWGPCLECGEFKRTFEKLSDKMVCIAELRQNHPVEKSEWVEEDGFEFCWGGGGSGVGSGLSPAKKKRLVRRQLVEPSDFREMIVKLNEFD